VIFDQVIRTGEGSERTCEVRLVVLRYGQKCLIRGTFTDVTKRKQAEQMVHQQQLLEATEREQRRFGQDLHDGIGQELAGIAFLNKALLNKLKKTSRTGARETARIAELLDGAIQHVRALSRGLHPIEAEPEALRAALQGLASRAEESFGVRCRFDCPQPVKVFDRDVATHMYRIAQEAVHNAAVHGQPRNIVIRLQEARGAVLLAVQDDGRGLPPPKARNPGLGLNVMQYRASMIGGRCRIRRGPGGGTIVTVTWKRSG
jgi:signal transduction histidine kinase